MVRALMAMPEGDSTALVELWTASHGEGRSFAADQLRSAVDAAFRGVPDGEVRSIDAGIGSVSDRMSLVELTRDAEVAARSIESTSLDQVSETVAAMVDDGESEDDIEAAIVNQLDDPSRVDRITATEATRAATAGMWSLYNAYDVEQMQVIDAGDNRVCPLCSANAAVGPFNVNDMSALPNAAPPTHPYCRCALVPVV
jgi:SPP1 gp7 family putative phage head morphogenesis protein